MGKMKDMLIDMMNEDWERCHLTDEVFRKEYQKEIEMEYQLWLSQQPAKIETYDNQKVSENPGAGTAPGFIHVTGVRSGEGGLLPFDGAHEVRGLPEPIGEQGLCNPNEGWEVRGDHEGSRFVQGSKHSKGLESKTEGKSNPTQ